MTKVEIIQKALEDKKATNIEVLDVAEQTSLADYFVVASCQSNGTGKSVMLMKLKKSLKRQALR